MKTTTTLPDLAQSFGKLKTLIDLEARVNVDTIFGFAVKNAFIQKASNDEIIKMIKDQLKDGRNIVAKCIPIEIIREIEKHWPDNDPDDLKSIKF